MLTPEEMIEKSSTKAVRDMISERLSFLITDATIRIELFLRQPYKEDDPRLDNILFRLTEALALTDDDESLGNDARGLTAQSDQGYSWSRDMGTYTTGFPMIDSLLVQYTQFSDTQPVKGNVRAMLI